MTTGITKPSISGPDVLALNCLQNSMMLTPACPRAGPTGGAGVALPAAICSLIIAETFLPLGPGAAIEVHVIDHSGEVVERAVHDLDRLVLLKRQLGLGAFPAGRHAVDDLVH